MSRAAPARADLAARRQVQMEAILQAAILEFAENGLNGASTQAIADRAGIPKTRLHYYITSKEDLYVQALGHIVGVWTDLFLAPDHAAGPEAFLRDYIRRKLTHAVDHPEVARLFTGEVMRGAPYLRTIWDPSREAVRRAAAVIEGWIARGLIRPVDPMLLQFNLWGLTEHYALHISELRFHLGLGEGDAFDLERAVEEVTELVLRGLRP